MVWGIFRSEVLSDVCSKASEEEIESANGESYFDIVKRTEEPSAPAADASTGYTTRTSIWLTGG